MDGLAALVEERLRVLQGRIDLRRDESFESARASLLAGGGAELMAHIHAVIAEAAADEDALLRQRVGRARGSEARTFLAFALGRCSR